LALAVKRAELARKIREVALIHGRFRLRSGTLSDSYFDKYLFESDPRLLHAIAEHLAALLPPGTDVLCGLEMGGIPIATVLSQVTGIPSAFIRKAAKTYGTEKFAEGPSLTDQRIVLVEDVVSSGGALLDAATKLRNEQVAVSLALCVIDRQSGGREALAHAGIELGALFTMTEIDAATG
jgi:orotate phosphoribosyltransferase